MVANVMSKNAQLPAVPRQDLTHSAEGLPLFLRGAEQAVKTTCGL
jgi:hypothetical protein